MKRVPKPEGVRIYTSDGYINIKETVNMHLGGHFELMFTDRLELFIPVIIIFSIVVWFFNDKIKGK